MRDDLGRLDDILSSIERIQERIPGGRNAFDRGELLQVWVVHHLQIIGEAVRGLSAEFRAAHPEVPWSSVVGMRNLLIHECFAIDLEEVWSTAVNDLPALQIQLNDIRARLRR